MDSSQDGRIADRLDAASRVTVDQIDIPPEYRPTDLEAWLFTPGASRVGFMGDMGSRPPSGGPPSSGSSSSGPPPDELLKMLADRFERLEASIGHMETNLALGQVPVSGGVYEISQYQAHRFRNLPIWAFHNRGDKIIRCKDTENMIDSINKEGGNAKLTIYEVEGHDADVTFKKRELYEWFNSLHK